MQNPVRCQEGGRKKAETHKKAETELDPHDMMNVTNIPFAPKLGVQYIPAGYGSEDHKAEYEVKLVYEINSC